MSPDDIKSVSDAARFMDGIKPGWEKKIQLSNFNICDPSKCILGQTYGYYTQALKELKINETEVFFSFSKYNEDWIREIKQRNGTMKFGFDKALEYLNAGRKVKWYTKIVHKSKSGALVNDSGSAELFSDALFSQEWELVPNTTSISSVGCGQKFKYNNEIYEKVMLERFGDNLSDVFGAKCLRTTNIAVFNRNIQVETA